MVVAPKSISTNKNNVLRIPTAIIHFRRPIQHVIHEQLTKLIAVGILVRFFRRLRP